MAQSRPVEQTAEGEAELVLLLLGKTGHGKSSTGNTILGRHAFQTSDDSESQTYITQSGWSRIGSRVVQVVDGPGVCETRLARGEAAQKMVADMSRGIILCPNGFDALLIVCRYGIRFTEEEVQAVEALKSVFGPNFIKDFGVLVFTHGEQLDMKNKKQTVPQSFKEWCKGQNGAMKDLINECEGRCVLFRNMEGDDDQSEPLLHTVERLKQRGVRYTKDLFQSVKEEQERFCAKENAAVLRVEIQRKISLLQDSVTRAILMSGNASDLRNIEGVLDTLMADARALKNEIETHDKGTGMLDSLKVCVETLEQTIQVTRTRIRDEQETSRVQTELNDLRVQLQQSENRLRTIQDENKESFGEKLLKAAAVTAKILVTAAPLIMRLMSGNPNDDLIGSGPLIEELTDSDLD